MIYYKGGFSACINNIGMSKQIQQNEKSPWNKTAIIEKAKTDTAAQAQHISGTKKLLGLKRA